MTTSPPSNLFSWIDVAVPLHDGMVHWPGDVPVRIERTQDMAKGSAYNISQISMSAHTGTHVDAPLHFIAEGKSIDEMPLEIAVSRARVIAIRDEKSVKVAELGQHNIRSGECILFKTRNSPRAWQTDDFYRDYVYVTKEAADYLVARGVAMVGIDYLSAGSLEPDGILVHQTLLGNGVWLVEGLDLTLAAPGTYDLICLPLRILRGDGAPARVILKPVNEGRTV